MQLTIDDVGPDLDAHVAQALKWESVEIPPFSSDHNAAFAITERCFNTWGLEYHDAYTEWECWADPQRRLREDCRFKAWGETAPLAICAVILSINT